jgi:tetratricopeptide (TPR) repeat protein
MLQISEVVVNTIALGGHRMDVEAFRKFRRGLAQLRDGESGLAAELLRAAVDRDPENPYYVSYYGLSLGQAEGNWAEAERLCHSAVCRGRRQAQLYLNLAEVYLGSGRRQAASDTLALGLRYTPHDSRLQEAFGRLAVRRPPVLRFLPRAHLLNRHLGRLRHRMLQRLPRRKWLPASESGA